MKDENIGKTFGIYTILDVCDEKDASGHSLYECQCNVCKGIFRRKLFRIKHTQICRHCDTHWENQRIGKIFTKMMHRCYNSNDKAYKWYGAKEIKICNAWLNNPILFEQWALSNGYQNNLTIDRIDVDKDYCPTNCRWIPIEENARRAGNVTWLTIQDETLTGRQWAAKLRIGVNTINTAIRKHGIEKTKKLIEAMLKEPPATKQRKINESWFAVYNI